MAAAFAALIGLGGVAAPTADAVRYRSMPDAERTRIDSNWKRFGTFQAARQAELRRIDEQLGALSADERGRMLGQLRAYKLWLDRQPRARRAQLAEADFDTRKGLVQKWWIDPRARQVQNGRPKDVLQVSALALQSIRRSVLELKLWYAMRPRQRFQVLRQSGSVAQRAVFERIVARDPRLSSLGTDEGKLLNLSADELREVVPVRREVGRILRPRVEPLRRVADLKYYRDHADVTVSDENRRRFALSLPSWIRESMDALPADGAVQRLNVLYRQVFPEPREIPATEPLELPTGPTVGAGEPSQAEEV